MAAPPGPLFQRDGSRQDVVRTRPRHRPRWMTWALRVVILLTALSVGVAGVAYVYLRVQLDKIDKIDLPGLVPDETGDVMNVLLVGSDSRSNVTGFLAEESGKDIEGDREGLSDTMMVLHIDPKAGQAAILSIPRDLWLTVDGSKDRINSAFASGGPSLLIKTIQDNLGIQINHYVEVDLEGFRNIVDTVGGLKVYIDAPARDHLSGLDLPDAGCVQVDGFQALAYVRSRYYEYYEAGRWVADGTSDFGRIKRQQDFIRRMMRKAVSSGISNPLTLNRLVSIGVNNLTIDKGMSTKDIVTVARRFKSLDPDNVDMETLPTTEYTTAGGAEVLLLMEEEAQPLIDKINGKAPLQPQAIRPADVLVRVLNGTGADGVASKATFALHNAGFATSGTPGDADSFTYNHTVIRYSPGKQDKAALLKSYLPGGATLEQDQSLGATDLTLIVGGDYTGVRPGPAGAGADAGPGTTVASPSPTPDARGTNKPAC